MSNRRGRGEEQAAMARAATKSFKQDQLAIVRTAARYWADELNDQESAQPIADNRRR